MASKGFAEAQQDREKGAICQWASALPRIALVTKSEGLCASARRRESPVNGNFNHGPSGCTALKAAPLLPHSYPTPTP
jgi:hypothetical protein